MSELSIFVDESGDAGSVSRYYLLTFIQHDQSDSIAGVLATHRKRTAGKGLPDIAFHMGPLLNGHDDYKGLDIATRKELLHTFRITGEHLPFTYHAFAYKKGTLKNDAAHLAKTMRRDLTNFLFDHLEFFQSFDKIKIYYDDGQGIVTESIHSAVEYVLAKDAVIYREARPQDYFLLQLADYVCGIELTAIKYEDGCQTATDRTFFGDRGSFKRNFLRKLRRHLLA
jgi:hypothetical protein